ncbi:MAG: calcium/sodium antiporter [Phycisphaerales bacterium]
MAVVLILLGLTVLTVGAEVLLRGAVGLARAVGMSPLVIGLTVVAFGTSAPELAVSLKAAAAGKADIALGNVVGSNTFNVLFILGVSALIVPLAASRQLVRLDVPVMIVVSLLAWLFAADGRVGRVEGILLFSGLLAYTAWLVRLGRREAVTIANTATEPGAPAAETAAPNTLAHTLRMLVYIVVGLGCLILGARWLVDGAVSVAQALGASDLLIGLTIIAAGTSMPEVATSIMASIRGQRDIAIGNVVGSNIFNLLCVLGATATIAPDGVPVAPAALRFDIPVMAAVALACLPIFFTGGRIARWEAALFLAYYAAYIVFLVLTATRHAALDNFSAAVLWFAVPLTVLGIGISVLASLRAKRSAAPAA